MDNLRELEEETEKAREKFDEMLRRLNPQKAQEHSWRRGREIEVPPPRRRRRRHCTGTD